MFHLAAGTVEPLIQPPGVDLGGRQRGDDEAWIGLARGPFGLADDAADAAPTVAGGPADVLEAAGGVAGSFRPGPRRGPPGRGLAPPARVARPAGGGNPPAGFAP